MKLNRTGEDTWEVDTTPMTLAEEAEMDKQAGRQTVGTRGAADDEANRRIY